MNCPIFGVEAPPGLRMNAEGSDQPVAIARENFQGGEAIVWIFLSSFRN
jgi:hypothetical protein